MREGKNSPPVRRKAFQTTHDLVFRRSGSPWGAFQSRIPIKNKSIPHGDFFQFSCQRPVFFFVRTSLGDEESKVFGLVGVKCVGGWERSAPRGASRRGPPDYSESNLKQLFTSPKQVSNNPKQVLNNFLTTPKQV